MKHPTRRAVGFFGFALLVVIAAFSASCSSAAPAPAETSSAATPTAATPTTARPTAAPTSIPTPDPTPVAEPTVSPTASPVPVAEASFLDGLWEIDGYGYLLEIQDEGVTTAYLPVGDYCMPAEFPVALLGAEPDGSDAAIVEFSASITSYHLTRVDLPSTCETFNLDATPVETIDAFITLFDLRYPFFEAREFDWPAAQAELRTAAAGAVSSEDAADVISAFMWELGDTHNAVNAQAGPPADVIEEYMALEAELEAAMLDVEIALSGSEAMSDNEALSWGMIDDIGYLRIERLAGMTADGDDADDLRVYIELLDQALSDLASTDQLIIDLRTNGGGNDQLSLETTRRFVSGDVELFTKEAFAAGDLTRQTVVVGPSSNVRYDGDLYVLVSPATASAAEVLGVGLRQGAGAIVIGPRSEGIFSDVIPWLLPGGVEMQMSMEVYRDLEGVTYEVRGVPVDQVTSIGDALATARSLAASGSD